MTSRHYPGGTEENNENLSQDSRSPGRDLNPGPHEYEVVVLSAWSVTTHVGLYAMWMLCSSGFNQIKHADKF
jgi:hypothetical protein